MNETPDKYALTEDGKYNVKTVALLFGLNVLAVLLVAHFASDLRWTYLPPCVTAAVFVIALDGFSGLLKFVRGLLIVQLVVTYIYITPPTAPPQVDCVQTEAGQ